jgi:hypothetical protein
MPISIDNGPASARPRSPARSAPHDLTIDERDSFMKTNACHKFS